MRITSLTTGLALAAGVLTACGDGGVDASCDVAGVTDEIHHILSDSEAELGETLGLTCADGWSTATVVVQAPEGDSEETFVFRGLDGDWVLTSLIEACDAEGPLAAPQPLREKLCAG